MKLERLDAARKCQLWEFFKDNLPPGLRVAKAGDGYGHVLYVRIKNDTWHSYLNFFDDGIAIVRDEDVELFQPQYLSDFEDVCRKYEKATGKEVTLRYWEGK